MKFPKNDKYWNNAKNFLKKHAHMEEIILAPGEFSEYYKNIIVYTDTTFNSKKKGQYFNWVVIHKGWLIYIDRNVMMDILKRFRPVFANEVFVIYTKNKNISRLRNDNIHLRSLYEKLGINMNLIGKLKKTVKKILMRNFVEKRHMLNEVGKIIKSRDNFTWIRRDISDYFGMNQDDIGINVDHEIYILKKIMKYSSRTKVFIDIGAHVGFFSIRLASKFKWVCSIEPNPQNLQALKINAILNNINNIQIINKGCWSIEKRDKLYCRGGGSFLKESLDRQSDDEEFEIELITLDSITKGIREPLFIKIDTEGAELDILKGADNTLKRKDVTLIVEHHENVYGDLVGRKQELLDFMKKYRYTRLYMKDNSKLLFSRG